MSDMIYNNPSSLKKWWFLGLCSVLIVTTSGCSGDKSSAQDPATVKAALGSTGYTPDQKAQLASLAEKNKEMADTMKSMSANGAPANFKGNH